MLTFQLPLYRQWAAQKIHEEGSFSSGCSSCCKTSSVCGDVACPYLQQTHLSWLVIINFFNYDDDEWRNNFRMTISVCLLVWHINPSSHIAITDWLTDWLTDLLTYLDCVWNVMAHAQKPDFVFRWNERVHLNRQGRQFSRLLAAEVCASAVVMLDTPCSEVVWRVLATHSICQFPLHFPSRASPSAITLQLDSTYSLHAAQSFLRS